MQVDLPAQADVETELLLFLAKQIQPIETHRVYSPLTDRMRLTRLQRAVSIKHGDGEENAWKNRVRFARLLGAGRVAYLLSDPLLFQAPRLPSNEADLHQ